MLSIDSAITVLSAVHADGHPADGCASCASGQSRGPGDVEQTGESWGEVGRSGEKWGEVGSPNSRCSFRDAKASWDLAIKGQGPLPYYK